MRTAARRHTISNTTQQTAMMTVVIAGGVGVLGIPVDVGIESGTENVPPPPITFSVLVAGATPVTDVVLVTGAVLVVAVAGVVVIAVVGAVLVVAVVGVVLVVAVTGAALGAAVVVLV
jgi:hypothetical protein